MASNRYDFNLTIDLHKESIWKVIFLRLNFSSLKVPMIRLPEFQAPITRLIESSPVWKSVSRGQKINLFYVQGGTFSKLCCKAWKTLETSVISFYLTDFLHKYRTLNICSRIFRSQHLEHVRNFLDRSSSPLCSLRNIPNKLIAVIDWVSKLPANLFLRILILKFLTCFTRLTN